MPPQKENVTPNRIPHTLEVKRKRGILVLRRVEGPAGEPVFKASNWDVPYRGCKCGGIIYIPLKNINDDQRTQSVRVYDHMRGAKHKKAEDANASAFAASLRRPLPKAVDCTDRNHGPGTQRPFSQLGDGPLSSARPRPGVSSQTPAALLAIGSPGTDGNFTLPCPDGLGLGPRARWMQCTAAEGTWG